MVPASNLFSKKISYIIFSRKNFFLCFGKWNFLAAWLENLLYFLASALKTFSSKGFFYLFLKQPALKNYIFSKKAFLIFRKQNFLTFSQQKVFLIFWERYIQNHEIFRIRTIFRTLIWSEPEAYSGHCQTSTM